MAASDAQIQEFVTGIKASGLPEQKQVQDTLVFLNQHGIPLSRLSSVTGASIEDINTAVETFGDNFRAFIVPEPTTVAAAGDPSTGTGEVPVLDSQFAGTGGPSDPNAIALDPRVPTPEDVSIPSTASPEELARQNLIREGQTAVAAGETLFTPGTNLEAVPTDLTGTISPDVAVQQINQPSTTVIPAPVIAADATAQQAQVSAAANPLAAAASVIDSLAEVQAVDAQAAAEGEISEGATAAGVEADTAGTQAQAAEVTQIPAGATVQAVAGTMSSDEIASAAKVAGVETARLGKAKEQLKRAGLSDADILAFGNDPAALELRLTDFTEEQRGLIGGLPEEALVSTQMEQLLAGIESGEIPLWARPATAAVEQMLARRGLSASTIGRDSLVNAIVQAALPIASQNAQSIKESVFQQRGFEQQASLTEAQFKQQATLQNAQNSFNLNLRNLDAEQRTNLANSGFLQTVTLTDTSNRQQSAVQNAANLTSIQVESLDANGRIQQTNAQNFLAMDMANLSNEQQGLVMDSQFEQQRMLSNASAENARRQFNASTQTQVDQFMSSLAANISQFNTQQTNAMSSFNATEANKVSALNAQNEIQVQEFNTQMMVQVDQFNSNQDLAVQQWNAANAQAVEQSNVQWRRQANTADTAAQNAINQQNVQNSFSLTAQAQAAMWQELRDQATFDQQSYENKEDREAQLYAAAIGNESAAAESYEQTTHLINLANSFFA